LILTDEQSFDPRRRCARRRGSGHHAADIVVQIHDRVLTSDRVRSARDGDVSEERRDPAVRVVDTEIAAANIGLGRDEDIALRIYAAYPGTLVRVSERHR
jgi:hypothetical protein